MTHRTLLAAAVVALLAAAPSSAGAAGRPCTDSDRFLQQLRVTGASCDTGRAVMFGWARSSACIADGDGTLAERSRPCTVRRFRCTPKAAEGGVTLRCTRGRAVVRFFDSQG
jgi:hypothetical protein